MLEHQKDLLTETLSQLAVVTTDYNEIIKAIDAVFIVSKPEKHYRQIKAALAAGKHVLCESPIAMTMAEWEELTAMAQEKS